MTSTTTRGLLYSSLHRFNNALENLESFQKEKDIIENIGYLDDFSRISGQPHLYFSIPFFISTLLYTLPHSISTLLLPNYDCSSSSKSILACWDSRYCFILSELTTFFPVCSSKASFATLATDPPLAATCACSLIV